MRSLITASLFASLFTMAACSGTAVSGAQGEEIVPESVPGAEDEVSFADVLAQYQALNARLELIAAPLLMSNTELCPQTKRSLGLTVHTVSDYPPNLQPIARELLGVSNRLSIRTVRPGSPADMAGLKTGDDILQIAGNYIPRGDTAQRFYEAATQGPYKNETVNLIVNRGGETIETTAFPETICGYPVNVYFSEEMNGHTDGEQVLVTSQLMRNIPDNVNLALIIAHEMGHAIAGHTDQSKSKKLELKADRMALVLMQRAGYDINAAISYWQRANHPHADFQRSSKTHPSISERYENFKAEQTRIEKLNTTGQPLTFD